MATTKSISTYEVKKIIILLNKKRSNLSLEQKRYLETKQSKTIIRAIKDTLKANPDYSKYQLMPEISQTASNYFGPKKATTKKATTKKATTKKATTKKATTKKAVEVSKQTTTTTTTTKQATATKGKSLPFRMHTEFTQRNDQTGLPITLIVVNEFASFEAAYMEMFEFKHSATVRNEIVSVKDKKSYIYIYDKLFSDWKLLDIRQY